MMGVYGERRKLFFAPGPKFKQKGISNGMGIDIVLLIYSINYKIE